MPRSIGVMALLLAVLLAWAYWLAHPSKEQPSAGGGTVEIWHLDPEEIRTVTVTSERGTTVYEPDFSAGPEGMWVWVTEQPATPPAPEAKPQEGAPRPEQPANPPPPTSFKGNEAVETSVRNLALLRAQRRVGELSGLVAEDFGFPAPNQTLRIDRGADREPLKLEMGARTFGGAQRYIHVLNDDTVYLVPVPTLDNLTAGKPRLIDRRLLADPPPSAERIELRKGENTVTLWQLSSGTAARAQWGTNPSATEADPMAEEWIDSLSHARVVDYLAAAALPEDAVPALEVRFYVKGKAEPQSWLRFFGKKDEGWILVSSHTRRAVMVNPGLPEKLVEIGTRLLPQQH